MKATIEKIIPEAVKPDTKLTLELTPQETYILYSLGNYNKQMGDTLSVYESSGFTAEDARTLFRSLYRALENVI